VPGGQIRGSHRARLELAKACSTVFISAAIQSASRVQAPLYTCAGYFRDHFARSRMGRWVLCCSPEPRLCGGRLCGIIDKEQTVSIALVSAPER
jgi:hypothetical protein